MRKLFFVPVLLLFSTAVTAFDEKPVSKQLDPMEKPEPSEVGYVWEGVNDSGDTVTYEVLAREGEETQWRDETGCTWTRPSSFAPSTSWSKCSGGGATSGSQNIYESEGNPWPLSDGGEFSFKFTGVGAGYSWRSTRECEVVDQVRVKVPAGEYDTFKVYCEDKWNKFTWWLSPQLEELVAFKRYHKRDKNRRYTEMLVKTTEFEGSSNE